VETSPAITDIDNDGKLEVVFGSYDKKSIRSKPIPWSLLQISSIGQNLNTM
jgi:hypothetical protein